VLTGDTIGMARGRKNVAACPSLIANQVHGW
jgi:hypothetical protein